MAYRSRMHSYTDPEAPLDVGKVLLGRTAAEAIAQAASLWEEGAYAAARGCLVMDTDDGTILWRSGPGPEAD
jgi:hypothetical protein